jgi:hypothetical protein
MTLGFVETLLVGLASGAFSGYATYRVQERKLQMEYKLQDSAQRVTHLLLAETQWPLRSFKVIRHHLAGFEDDELRRLLVRAGAIRFKSKSGEELWGLIDRNRHRLGVTQIDQDPQNLRDSALFLPEPKSDAAKSKDGG